MTRRILCVVAGLFLIVALCGSIWAGEERYPIMKPDRTTLKKWVESYENAPEAFIDEKLMEVMPLGGSLDLISHIQYTPADRNQGTCGNCWVWAGMGVIEIALDVQEGIKDRLSIQHVNSCDAGSYACCGGWLEDLVDFYNVKHTAIPWSNAGASFQDAGRRCSNGMSSVGCVSITTKPSYGIKSIAYTKITTQSVSKATAITNIKNVLNQNKGVWFGFFLPDDADWDVFYDFWDNETESDIWNPDYSCGHNWVEDEGGGHAILIVGYNDDDEANPYWVVLNSWGTASGGRPNGLLRLDMNMDYSCTFYDPADAANYWSHYFQTLDVEFCPSESVLNHNKGKLDVLRRMRDTKMASTAMGSSLAGIYYKHAGEISSILQADKGLKLVTTDVVEKIVEKAAVLNSNGKVEIDKELVDNILEIADEINREAGPGLKMAIKKVKRMVKKGTILKQLGVTVE